MKASLRETICHMLQKLGLISDWVVEQGTSGIWTYRKWNSGIAECWGCKTITSGVNIAANGGYMSIQVGILPFDWENQPVGVGSGGGYSNPQVFEAYFNVYYNNGKRYGIDAYVRNQRGSAHTGSVWLNVYVVGLWKAFSGGGTA